MKIINLFLLSLLLLTTNGYCVDFETEPNNNSITADVLTPSDLVTGQLYSDSDADWYVFGSEQKDMLAISVSVPGEENIATDNFTNLKLSVYDINGTMLFDNLARNEKPLEMGLEAGTYYLKMATSNTGVSSYSVAIAFSNHTPPKIDNPLSQILSEINASESECESDNPKFISNEDESGMITIPTVDFVSVNDPSRVLSQYRVVLKYSPPTEGETKGVIEAIDISSK